MTLELLWILPALALAPVAWLFATRRYERKLAVLQAQLKAVRQTAAEHADQARKQVAQNFFWFVPTIVAHGNHIAVWVDGYQVTDFTDTRPPSENAKEGSRTGAGHLGLQASGDQPDVYFKTISIARLPSDS